VKVEPSRLPTTNIFVHNLISRIKYNTEWGVWWISTKFNSQNCREI